jgi:hypothetical protein
VRRGRFAGGGLLLEQKGTQNHTYTRAEFVKRFREHFDDGGKLNQLLR